VNDALPGPQESPASFDVVAIGSALVDVLSDASAEDLRRFDLAKGSMTLVDLARAATLYKAKGPAIELSGGSADYSAVGFFVLVGRLVFLGKVVL
jgi:hypothetical protein